MHMCVERKKRRNRDEVEGKKKNSVRIPRCCVAASLVRDTTSVQLTYMIAGEATCSTSSNKRKVIASFLVADNPFSFLFFSLSFSSFIDLQHVLEEKSLSGVCVSAAFLRVPFLTLALIAFKLQYNRLLPFFLLHFLFYIECDDFPFHYKSSLYLSVRYFLFFFFNVQLLVSQPLLCTGIEKKRKLKKGVVAFSQEHEKKPFPFFFFFAASSLKISRFLFIMVIISVRTTARSAWLM